LAQIILGRRDSRLYKNKGDCPSPRGGNSKRVKMFSRTSTLKSNKLVTNYPLVKIIQVCPSKGPGPFQRGNT
jgi:hypothetical protein